LNRIEKEMRKVAMINRKYDENIVSWNGEEEI